MSKVPSLGSAKLGPCRHLRACLAVLGGSRRPIREARHSCANHSRLKLKHTDVHHRCTRALPCPTCAVRAPPSYLRMMSAFWSWNSRKPSNTMSPCGHGSRGATLGKSDEAECQAWQECRRTTPIQTRLRSFPRMWHNRLTPSKQKASSRPFPSILVTCAYSVQSGSEGWQACAGGACPTTAGHLDRPP